MLYSREFPARIHPVQPHEICPLFPQPLNQVRLYSVSTLIGHPGDWDSTER